MTKKITLICILTVLVFACTYFSAYASDSISLVINSKKVECEVPPVIVNDRTLVPVRVLFEHLDAKVDWNGSLRQVMVTSGTTVMIFNIDSKIVYLNGAIHTLDAAPVIINDRTLVPVRFISEKLGFIVGWDGSARCVSITKPKEHSSSVSITKPPADDVNDKRIKLTSVKLNETKTSYEIIVALEKKVTPKTMSLKEPDRLIFDFYDVNQTISDSNIPSKSEPLKEVRWAEHEDYTRLVVETSEECKYLIAYLSDGSCKITIQKSGIISSSAEDEEKKDEEQEPPKKQVIVPNGTPIVVLDAGHGGYDPGAIGKDANGNDYLYEKDVCLDIAKRTKLLLEAQGVDVIMTRNEDISFADSEMDDLIARCDIANNSGACLFVSIHNNAFTNPAASGACVLYSGLSSNYDYGITNKKLAQNIQDSIISATSLYDRGIVESPGIVVLKKTVMPAVLIECAFITNPSDQLLLGSDNGRAKFSAAITRGITSSLRHMGWIK